MAVDHSQAESDQQANPAVGPLSPAARQRLQKLFDHATRNSAKNDFDYANDLFKQCVAGDPASIIYLQSFFENLKRKYDNNKKGAKLSGMKTSAAKKSLKAALGKENWSAALNAGCDVLRYSPWDAPTLIAMAQVCERLGADECQLYYLKWALNADPKNIAVNKQAARTLTRMGQFDQAIACWHRVEEVKPHDGEASSEISRLTVEKAVHHGGYDRELIEGKPTDRAPKNARTATERSGQTASGSEPPSSQASRETFLREKIDADPSDVSHYIELARLYEQQRDFASAEERLQQALTVSGGGDLAIRERLEDVQMRRGRHQLAIAQKRAANEPGPQAEELVRRLKSQVNQFELEVFAARSDRDPKNQAFKVELGIRLKIAGKFRQAIEVLQAATSDKKCQAQALLEAGECFQHLQEYDSALNKYQAAIAACGDAASDTRKLALYRAGVLATGLRELDEAQQFFADLATVDADYRDVQARLDKVEQLRNKG